MSKLNKSIDWIAGGISIGAIILAVAGKLKRNRDSVSGIGAAKRKVRRIWSEVEAAQKAGIDLTDPDGWRKHESVLRRMAQGKLSASKSEKPDEQRYFGQLRRAYKSIAGTGLPHDQSIVRNEYGDVILIYNDYHLDELPKKAAQWIFSEEFLSPNDLQNYGYWATIANIALGRIKFVWTAKAPHRGIQQLIFGQAAPMERKQRISYLASPEKGGVYPEQYAHRLWESLDGRGDDTEILDGVLEAIRTCSSVGQAQQICVEQYIQAHAPQEASMWEDVPF